MSVTFVKGDLFADDSLPALAHGCNCAGAMGKGIALRFRERYPAMYEAYRAKCRDRSFDLGDVFEWVEGGRTVFNLGTQKTWRSGADLSAIEAAIRRMLEIAEARGIQRIGIPRIGAGLGGLEWKDVRERIEVIARSSPVELIVFESFERRA